MSIVPNTGVFESQQDNSKKLWTNFDEFLEKWNVRLTTADPDHDRCGYRNF